MLKRHIAAVALIAAVAAGVYCRTAGFSLLEWDDTTYVTGNPRVQELGRAWADTSKGWMPVTESAWALVYRFRGCRAMAYHVLNVVFHSLNSALVYLLALAVFHPARPMGAPHTARAAWLTGGFFALHPVQAEAVCWVTSLRDLTAAFFSLCALLAYLVFVDRDRDGTRTAKWSWYTAALACFCLATLSKATTAALIGVAWLSDRVLFRRPHCRSALHLAPWLLAAGPALALNVVGQSRLYLEFLPPLWLRPLIALDAIGFYLRKITLPFGIMPAYGRSARWLLESGTYRWSWIVAVAAGVTAFLVRRRTRLPWYALWVLVVSVLPVSGILAFAAQNNTTVCDHYVYFGLLGPALVFGGLSARLERRAWAWFPWAIVLGLGLLALGQMRIWRTDRSLWEHTLSRDPDNTVALVSLGRVHYIEGRPAEALRLYRRAVGSSPRDFEAQINLGALLSERGAIDEAAGHFRSALALNPASLVAHDNMAEYWLCKGAWTNAHPHIRYVLEHRPDHIGANSKLAEHCLHTGQPAACIGQLEPVLRPVPPHANLYNLLGAAYAQSGRREQAIAAFTTAVRLAPHHAGARANLRRARSENGDESPEAPE